MKPVKRWSLIVVGCGTANLACARALARADVAQGLESLAAVDPAVIREINAVTCPEYAGHRDKMKVERLAELAGEWFPAASIAIVPKYLEEVDWPRLLEIEQGRRVRAGPLVVLAGLDDWGSRLRLVETLRHAAAKRPQILPVQVAVDRDEAQVTVLGNRWQDSCPACGIFPLPESEPCVVLSADGQLARGDLQREARAAAELVAKITSDYLAAGEAGVQGVCPWVGTKTNLKAESPGSERFTRYRRRRTRVPSCMGPHGLATPLRPEDLCDAGVAPAI